MVVLSSLYRETKHPGKQKLAGVFSPWGLVIQLKGKLDLARIVWVEARASDLAEVRISEVARTADGHHTVAAEVGRVEVWMVEDVKELGPEFRSEPLCNRELLEHREIETMDTGAHRIARLGSEGGRAVKRDAAGRRVGYGSEVARSAAQLAWLVECLRVIQPEGAPRPIDNLGLNPPLLTLTRNQDRAAPGSRNAPRRTAEIERLPTLRRHNPVDRPSAQDCVRDAPLVQVLHAFAKGELVAAAEVYYVADVEICRPPVEPGPESRNAQSSKWTTIVSVACGAAI